MVMPASWEVVEKEVRGITNMSEMLRKLSSLATDL